MLFYTVRMCSYYCSINSLIKMLYYMCNQTGLPPSNAQLEHAVKRNFSGLESDVLDPYEIFMRHMPRSDEKEEDTVKVFSS